MAGHLFRKQEAAGSIPAVGSGGRIARLLLVCCLWAGSGFDREDNQVAARPGWSAGRATSRLNTQANDNGFALAQAA